MSPAAKTLKALVITGDGINCEAETAEAFRLAGFDAEVFHLNELIQRKMNLDQLSSEFSAVALPGGFSFGDDLASGRVLALKILHALRWDLHAYATRGGLVIGICNGFQALIRMGLFGKAVSITHNQDGHFINRWVRVAPKGNKCAWLRGVGTIDLPIRHGEGRIIVAPMSRGEVLSKLERQGMLCLNYDGPNPNGSESGIAGLCDTTGRIFGLMPHPEAFVRWTSHPDWTSRPDAAGSPGDGLAIFENAFQEAKGSR
ncbi:MAG: phosphoribosylformylglycinamidine synthase subunit PurQ [Bacteriovoracia bacterium]